MNQLNRNQLNRGDQIAYVPNHAGQQDLAHKDVEFGFVTSGPNDAGGYFCRFFYKNTAKYGNDLRTKGNSESTPIENIVPLADNHPLARPRWVIDAALEKFC